MKKIYYLIICLSFSIYSYSQEATNLKIFDTRDIVDAPSFIKRSIRADLKKRATSEIPGTGIFSTSITIAPWSDSTGGYNHQLSFNNDGIYYRQGNFDETAWKSWHKLLLVDSSGSLGSNIRLGRVGEIGNQNVEIGGQTIQYNIDFTGYRDVKPNQIGARISALRFNRHSPNLAYIQNTALAFYTNDLGLNDGTTDLIERMRISPQGNVGIGTDSPRNKLDVAGTIRATEVKVETGWADFVFDKDYRLLSLEDVESHINEYKHLPDIPSEAEVKKNGVSLGEMQAKLLQKIEELTLYVISQDKTIKEQGEKIQKLEAERQNKLQ